ncbi:MAG: 1-acyl-sn-glycerol-3-phosphate acyltransferase [Clostridiales bacterium]|jgi:1-acyl-sn-glycerol-3-phosphate acyltransferase|nr:1-acyl-sn-glycerol-3-phosphate acyltransferase [Clostridiales bacterium]
MNFFYSFARFILYPVARLFLPATVVNKKNFPRRRNLIVVANHLSWQDAPLLAVYTPYYRHFFAKKEAGEKFLPRLLLKWLGVILVDRDKPELSSIRKILTYLKKGHGVNIFPEGTRNKTGTSQIQQVKSGAAMFAVKSKTPIVPVMIYSKTKFFRRNFLYVGEEFSLTEFEGRPLKDGELEKAAAIVEEALLKTKAQMDEYVLTRFPKNAAKIAKSDAAEKTANTTENAAESLTAAENATATENATENAAEKTDSAEGGA